MIMSCLVRLSGVKCLGDVIPFMSAFGLVIPVTLKEFPRLQPILSARPLVPYPLWWVSGMLNK